MTKQSVFCAIFFSLLISCGVLLAQTNLDSDSRNEQDPCARHSMRVVTPSAEVDYKLQVAKPTENVDYKAKVTNPCALPEIKNAKATTTRPSGERRINSVSPSLKLLPPTEGKLKSPSETLKDYALPVQPNKDQRMPGRRQ